MGIDVYTTSLASHLRNVDRASAAALRTDEHLITMAGLKASLRTIEFTGQNLGPLGAYLCARAVRTTWARAVVAPGNPSASLGPMLHLQVDRMSPRTWLRLVSVMSACRSGGDHTQVAGDDDAPPKSFFDDEWDEFDSIAFARAVDRAQCIIVPSKEPIAFFAGGIAVTSTFHATRFISAAVAHLGFEPGTAYREHDPDMSKADNEILYNLRLFSFHIRQADMSRQPMGIWG